VLANQARFFRLFSICFMTVSVSFQFSFPYLISTVRAPLYGVASAVSRLMQTVVIKRSPFVGMVRVLRRSHSKIEPVIQGSRHRRICWLRAGVHPDTAESWKTANTSHIRKTAGNNAIVIGHS